jgi:hypothetical protein
MSLYYNKNKPVILSSILCYLGQSWSMSKVWVVKVCEQLMILNKRLHKI